MPQSEPEKRTIVEWIGPRGIRGMLGWTFFDPVNLVSVCLLTIAAVLVVVSMQNRGAGDWYMALGLYVCIAAFLRGYIFNYYSGHPVSRVVVLLILLLGILGSAALWEERAAPHEVLRAGGVYHVPAAEGFHIAALLHVTTAIALLAHYCLPRRWLVRMTDEMVDRSGISPDEVRGRENITAGVSDEDDSEEAPEPKTSEHEESNA